MSATETTVTQRLTTNQEAREDSSSGDLGHVQPPPSSSTGLILQVDFAWSKFRNIISEKVGQNLTPRYIQHFRPSKPQLRFNSADDSTQIGTGTVNHVSISGECHIKGQPIELKPLKRWTTKYNYLSHTFASPSDPATPVPIVWTADCNMKTWDFVCLDADQLPIAKFAVNLWALKVVGEFQFESSGEDLSEEKRDEVVITGITVLYIMMCRINNPFSLIGAAIAKPGAVEEGKTI